MIRLIFVLILVTMLSACGWQLRGYDLYKNKGLQQIESISLQSGATQRLFRAALEEQLKDLSIDIVPNSPIRLSIIEEQTEKRPLSYSSTGIAVQYQLIMTVRYRVSKNNVNDIGERRLIARRQYDFDIQLVIAKKEEEQQLLQEMREELVDRIIVSLGD